jgi:hypothetical protein
MQFFEESPNGNPISEDLPLQKEKGMIFFSQWNLVAVNNASKHNNR